MVEEKMVAVMRQVEAEAAIAEMRAKEDKAARDAKTKADEISRAGGPGPADKSLQAKLSGAGEELEQLIA